MFSDVAEATMKHPSSLLYCLTSTAKTAGDSVWRAVLMGRYPPKK